MENLAQHFHRYFELKIAQSDVEREAVFKLRYEVYCAELGFEDAARFQNHMEYDDNDVRSLHAILIHRATGEPAGCFRLILKAPDAILLPFEQVCGSRLEQTEWHPKRVKATEIGEISRLAVHQVFRRRNGEQESPIGAAVGGLMESSSRQYPLVASGLFLGAAAMALECDLQRAYVMMEPRLARLLRSCGLMFRQVGEIIDYHGKRGPFMISRELLTHHLPPEAGELMNDFRLSFATPIKQLRHCRV